MKRKVLINWIFNIPKFPKLSLHYLNMPVSWPEILRSSIYSLCGIMV